MQQDDSQQEEDHKIIGTRNHLLIKGNREIK